MGNDNHLPPTRFSEYSDNWNMKSLGEIFSIINGYAFSSADSQSEGCRWVKIANVGINRMRNDAKSFLPIQYREKHWKFVLSKGDYVVALTRPILRGKLKIARVDDEFDGSLLNQRVGKIKSENVVDFIYYLLQRAFIIAKIENRIAGTDPPNLAPSEISSIKTYIPSPPEQQKIATFLSAVDKKIQLLQRKKELLEQYKKGVMQKIFSQEIRFKDENGNDYPDWEEKRLGDMLSLVVDNRGKTPPISENGIPLIEINAVGQRDIQYHKIGKYVSNEVFESWFRKYLSAGDVLFSTVGATALCSIYDGRIPSVIAQNLVGLRFIDEDQSFMYYMLSEAHNNHKFKRIEMGAVQPSVKVSQMINIRFLVPNLLEQIEISRLLSVFDKKIALLADGTEQLNIFKKGLLQQMFV
jgi:type I restriction enzyme, S subunit